MNLRQYITAAKETESLLTGFEADQKKLLATLDATIAAGNLLDVIKKDTFYGLPTSEQKLEARKSRLIENSDALNVYGPRAANLMLPSVHSYPTAMPQINPRVAHAIIGLATEAVELLEALREAIVHDKPIDGVNVLEELGDLNWYHAIAVDALGGNWEQIQETNIAKLRERNKGKKFNAQATIERDTVAERALLEEQFGDARSRAESHDFGGSDF